MLCRHVNSGSSFFQIFDHGETTSEQDLQGAFLRSTQNIITNMKCLRAVREQNLQPTVLSGAVMSVYEPSCPRDVKKRAESALNELKVSQCASSSQLTCRICSVYRRVTRCRMTTAGGGDGCVYQGLLLPLSRLPLSALLSRGASHFSRLNALATVNTLSSTFHWDEQTNTNHCAAARRGERRTCLY